MARRTILAIAVLALGIGPWMALPTGTVILDAVPAFAAQDLTLLRATGPLTPAQIVRAERARASLGCTCHTITVNAKNVVRDADVRTGDATVINKSITYVAPSYEDDDVEVEQTADAHSGDAIAGQVLGIAQPAGSGCARIHVTATNDVADSDVRSGDATAKNKSIILLDPSVNRGDLDIDVDQRADATSGNAIAGQIIGIAGGGGPCGGVVLDAMNRVSDTDVRSGDATIKNSSEILECGDRGCLKEIKGALADVATVSVCDGEFCHPVPTKDFIAMLKESFASSDETTDDSTSTSEEPSDPTSNGADSDSVPDPTPTPSPRPKHKPQHPGIPTPAPVFTPSGVMQASSP